jgi:hypothetical protein
MSFKDLKIVKNIHKSNSNKNNEKIRSERKPSRTEIEYTHRKLTSLVEEKNLQGIIETLCGYLMTDDYYILNSKVFFIGNILFNITYETKEVYANGIYIKASVDNIDKDFDDCWYFYQNIYDMMKNSVNGGYYSNILKEIDKLKDIYKDLLFETINETDVQSVKLRCARTKNLGKALIIQMETVKSIGDKQVVQLKIKETELNEQNMCSIDIDEHDKTAEVYYKLLGYFYDTDN